MEGIYVSWIQWSWENWMRPASLFLTAIVLGMIIHQIVFRVAGRLVKEADTPIGDIFLAHLRKPSRLMIPVLTIQFLLPLMRVPQQVLTFITQILSLLFIIAVAWTIIRLTSVFQEVVASRYQVDVKDNLRARMIQTQMQVLRKVVIAVVTVLALGAILMTFGKLRQLGTSILASAGLAGLVVGLAAQKTLANLLAGIQIALTQPIRLDDVVIVENEWGRIEEITLTYVVVRIWDLRRLIVPIGYFLEKPFQNWTRVSSDLLGTVFFYMDYSVPIQAVREELERIAKASPRWDGRVCVLQVTSATERTVELRALISAADSSSAWELRCEVRERLIEFVQKNYPESLPKLRTDKLCGKMD